MSPGALHSVISEVTNENKLGKADPRSEKRKIQPALEERVHEEKAEQWKQVGSAAHTAASESVLVGCFGWLTGMGYCD